MPLTLPTRISLNRSAMMAIAWLSFGAGQHSVTAPVTSGRSCDYTEMSDVLFAQRIAVCEYRGNLAVRVLDDSVLFIAVGDCRPDDGDGLCLLRVVTNPDAVLPRWTWRTGNGFARVQPGGAFIDPADGRWPALALGRSFDDLAAKYPNAYRIGIKRLISISEPHIDIGMFVDARPATGCRAGSYACFQSHGRLFSLR